MGRYDMNRFANALSAAIPSSGSDASTSSYLRESPRVASPLDPQVVVEQHRSRSQTRALYDDPRSTHFEAPLTKWDPATHPPRRPDLIKHRTEDGTSRSVSPGRRGFSRERRDQSVRVNALANRKGAGRLGAMAKGPDDKYAVGGGMALKVVQITRPASGDATPVADEVTGRRKSQREQVLGKGPGGIGVTEVVNLWRGSMAVGKGVNDISWGTGAFAHKLVTASPSGNFLLFDLNRGKLEKEISGGHPRPLNVVRLCQTPAHAHLLISGGTEGQAKMWDLRDRDPVNRKYFKHAASITSLCFSPDDPHQFVVGLENGAIQRYDLRHQKNGRVWGAHGSKAVLDLQWKEGSGRAPGQGWLASAGADRTVQIWDMAQSWDRGPTSLHTLHTAYPLRRVAWRPEHETELVVVPLVDSQAASLVDPSIASVSQGLGQESVALDEDSHLEIWDVRRHHIAKYTLPTVDGTAVEAAWSDSDTLVTAHQNGMFAQLDIRNKTIPLDSIPRQIMSWSSRGEVTYGIDRFKQGEIPFDDPKSEYANHWDKLGQKEKGPADPPYEPLQALGFLSLPVFDNDEFTYLANHYKIEGRTAEELCAWNGGVALMSGRIDDARCWALLQQYIEDIAPTPDNQFNENVFDKPTTVHSPTAGPSDLSKSPTSVEPTSLYSPEVIPLERLGIHDANDDVMDLVSDSSSSAGSQSGSITPSINRTRFITFAPHGTERTDLRASTSTAVPTHSNPHSQPPSRERSRQLRPRGHRRHSSSEEEDAYPDPYGISSLENRSRQSSTNTSRSSARSSPQIAPNHRVSTIKGSPVILPSRGTQGPSSGSDSVRQSMTGSTRPSLAGSARPSIINGKREKSGLVPTSRGWMDPGALERYKKERGEAILQWWRSYVDDGDAQMGTILYVVGSAVLDFPTKQAERVAHCYIEMLEQHRLAVPAAYIRRHAKITSLQIVLGDVGVTHLTYCSRCGKGTGSLEDVGMHNHGKRFWYCKRCRLSANTCVICQEGVKGLFMACAKCRHGGHQACMRSFYLDKPLNMPPLDTAGLSAGFGVDRDYLPLYGYGTSHESSTNIMGGERNSGETVRSDGIRRQTVLGWTGCPKGCGCKCRIVPIEREVEEL